MKEDEVGGAYMHACMHVWIDRVMNTKFWSGNPKEETIYED
jgi:hypothetical protein